MSLGVVRRCCCATRGHGEALGTLLLATHGRDTSVGSAAEQGRRAEQSETSAVTAHGKNTWLFKERTRQGYQG